MHQERVKKLTANKRWLFFANLFTELKFLNVIVQLFYLSRGLSVGQVVFLSVIWSMTTLVSELPSSYLADIIGRKKTLILGVGLLILGNFITLLAYGFWLISLGVVFLALGFAFMSGTDEAILYDTLKELKQESFSTKVSGKYYSSSSLAKIFTPLFAAVLAKDLTSNQFVFLVGLDLVGAILSLFFLTKIVEPQKFTSLAGRKGKILSETISLLTKDRSLLKFSVNKVGIFIATFVYWRVYQVFLKDRGVDVFSLGLISVSYQMFLTFVNWNIEKIKNRMGLYPIFVGPPILGVIALSALLVFPPIKIVLIIFTILVFCTGSVRDSVFLTQMQLRIPSFSRATTTSALNMIKSILDIPILFLVGNLVNKNVSYALYVALAIFISTMLFANIRKSDLKEEESVS